jgi:hypothetical protein
MKTSNFTKMVLIALTTVLLAGCINEKVDVMESDKKVFSSVVNDTVKVTSQSDSIILQIMFVDGMTFDHDSNMVVANAKVGSKVRYFAIKK